MDSISSSRRSYDLPKPDTGLAEWTSKIKALQKEVDADDEAEQKRLEEEIAAARKARLRRSRGMGTGSRVDFSDFTSNKENPALSFEDTPSTCDFPKSSADRKNDQETTLQKLMGKNDVYNPDKIAGSARADNTEGTSLAAFIGGRASGPRLNRHAPQQDVHDPTQFIQPDLSSPHPVFGKGGVAMPGMTAKKKNLSSPSSLGSESAERYQPSWLTGHKPNSNTIADKASITEPEKIDTNSRPPPKVVTQTRTFEKVELNLTKRDGVKSASSLPIKSVELSRSFSSSPSQAQKIEKNEPTFLLKRDGGNSTADSLPEESFETFYSSTGTTPSQPQKFETSYLAKKDSNSTYSQQFKSVDSPRTLSSTPTPPKPLPSYTGTSSNASPSNKPFSTATAAPLHRLMETNNIYNPDKLSLSKSAASQPQTVSLAAFIGGKASGPRLNRHAPQQDAHDPSQFIQPDTSTPHPIFGRGGIAMPGMTSRKDAEPLVMEDVDSRPIAKRTWPPKQTDNRPVAPPTRERTTSTPASSLLKGLREPEVRLSPNFHIPNKEVMTDTYVDTPSRDRRISGPSYSQNSSQESVSNLSSVSSRNLIVTPSLARPVEPKPKSSPLSPPFLGKSTSSPAFQKPSSQKDLTPSLSRLQGRGFVQNMVKASAQLETLPSPTSSPDKSRPPSAAGGKGSVLDRWQPNLRSTSPSKSSSPTYPLPIKKSNTHDTSAIHAQRIQSTSNSFKSVSFPSLAKAASTPSLNAFREDRSKAAEVIYPRSRTPGLGSATTMVLIQPNKSSSNLTQTLVDELGVKGDSEQVFESDEHILADISSSSNKRLIHPANDGSRKRWKYNTNSSEGNDRASMTLSGTNIAPNFNSAINLKAPNGELRTDSSENSSPMADIMVLDSNPLDESAKASSSPKSIVPGDRSVPLLSNTSSVLSLGRNKVELPPLSELSTASQETAFQDNSSSDNLNLQSSEFSYLPAMSSSSFVIPPIGRHARIPSTGNRPTVMEIARTLSSEISFKPLSGTAAENFVSLTTAPIIRNNLSQVQAEKRRSSYEKYSAIILPPLTEEATPVPSPVGTFTRQSNHYDFTDEVDHKHYFDEQSNNNFTVIAKQENEPASTRVAVAFPDINVSDLLRSRTCPRNSLADAQCVSVEVLAITGTTATTIPSISGIFYESEILAIIHRIKSRSSGLASTSIWCWLGRRSILGDRESRKLQDLAKQYRTDTKFVYQMAEPLDLIETLGGRLAVRQGTRSHWSFENTTMHLVRSIDGVILIDEHDLVIKNLCSAFSYCITVLGSVYIWNGCGSTDQERAAAIQYSETFSKDKITPILLTEGQDDEDEMFWMILGDDPFAKADYWRWRRSYNSPDPCVWKVDSGGMRYSVVPIEFISKEQYLQKSVYIVNCIWEFFVLVGKEARKQRSIIQFAVDLAMKMSIEASPFRPFSPTVHVLILPSQIPVDLLLGIRDFDEVWLNDGEIPDHMNLLEYTEAAQHLGTNSWERHCEKSQYVDSWK